MDDSDLPYVWGAYKMGHYDWPPGLDVEGMKGEVARLLGQCDEAYTAVIDGRPAGIALATFAGRRMEPHVDWFPWATKRNKVECAIRFFIEMRKDYKVLIFATAADQGFFDVMCRYGVIRRVGTLHKYGDDLSDAKLYESREP